MFTFEPTSFRELLRQEAMLVIMDPDNAESVAEEDPDHYAWLFDPHGKFEPPTYG